MMYRKSNAMSMKEAIQLLLETYRLGDKLKEVRLIGSWESVVGSMINRHTQAMWIKDKKLFVQLDSAALRMELSYSKAKLVKMLNKEVGAEVIEEIILR